jgi:hypothetical protein
MPAGILTLEQALILKINKELSDRIMVWRGKVEQAYDRTHRHAG